MHLTEAGCRLLTMKGYWPTSASVPFTTLPPAVRRLGGAPEENIKTFCVEICKTR